MEATTTSAVDKGMTIQRVYRTCPQVTTTNEPRIDRHSSTYPQHQQTL
jgi:hypothetical protein